MVFGCHLVLTIWNPDFWAAILNLQFLMRTFQQPSWIYHLKIELLVWILNGKFKTAAKNSIIDIYGITFKSQAFKNQTNSLVFKGLVFRSSLYLTFRLTRKLHLKTSKGRYNNLTIFCDNESLFSIYWQHVSVFNTVRISIASSIRYSGLPANIFLELG